MQGRGRGGHIPAFSGGGSISRTTQLANAYQELGKQLESKEIRQVGNYSLGRVIGEGTFGKVRLALHRLTSTRCAVKQIPRHLAPSALTREIHHHRRLHHPHVVQLYEVIATEQHIWLVSELCPGGELFDYLVEHGRLTETETRKMFGQLCLAVSYIHAQGVVHRDLKLENVLLDERCNVKVADFGFGREFEQRKLMETFCGSVGYSAPEMLAGRKYTGEEVDIWSLGIILYTLLCGSLPFDDDDEEAMKAKIIKGFYELPDFLTSDACELISSILQLEPKDRLSIKQILSHSWFTKPPQDPTFESMPPVIPEDHEIAEEPESLPPTTIAENGDAPVIESAPSDTSFQSARSSESSLSRSQTSRATTPVTSEDEAHSPRSLDMLAVEVTKELLPLQRQSSDATLTQGNESEESGSARTSAFRTTLPTHAEHDDSPERERPTPFRYPTGLGLASMTSPLSDGVPSSPMLPSHSRTPARTKRRSVSSTFSERLLVPYDLPASPDYLALLSDSTVEPLSTPAEKALLTSLASLGFDTGQIMHSIKTHACDASGATWWMLKRKADEREAEAKDFAASRSPSSDTFRRHRASATPTMLSKHSARGSDLAVKTDLESLKSPGGRESPNASLPTSPSHRRMHTVPATPMQTISPSASAPLLSNVDKTSPLSPRASISTMPLVVMSPVLPDGDGEGDSSRIKGKQRSSSVSMLSRAFSSSAGSTSGEGRSTPTSQFVGLFTRKSVGTLVSEKSRDKLRNPSTEALSASQPGSSATTPSKSSAHSPLGSPPLDSAPWFATSPAASTSKLTDASSARSGSPSASGSPRIDQLASQPRSRGSLFSNFKLWFNEDRRKRKRPPSTLSPLGQRTRPQSGTYKNVPAMAYGQTTPRRGSVQHRRNSSQHTAVALSRRSSAASAHGGHLRRGSASSRASSGPSSRPHSASGSVGRTESARMSRHYKSGSHSSTGSRRSALGSPGNGYRRTPTQTHVQVRRVSGSAAARRRPHSSASSVRSVNSRRSSITDDGLGEDHHMALPVADDASVIEEEPDEGLDAERQAALRKLSGEHHRPAIQKRPSTRSDDSAASRRPPALHGHRRSTGGHSSTGATIFTAHKTTHVFGTPGQRTSAKPKFRDVFARSPTGVDDEWLDEPEDHLAGFSRGFGQAADPSSSITPPASHEDRPVSVLGEGRYAGMMPKDETAPWRAPSKSAARTFKTTIAEEEEEEEE